MAANETSMDLRKNSSLNIDEQSENLRNKVKALVQQLQENTVDSPHLFGWLHLRIKDLSVKECKAIVEGLKVNRNNVKWLDISPINISSDGLVCILDSLKSNTRITKLRLNGKPNNDLYEEDDDDTYLIPIPGQTLMDVLQVNTTLAELIITDSLINDDDVRMIVTGLQTNTTLTEITFDNNQYVTVQSAHYLSHLVALTETLRKMNLYGRTHVNNEWIIPIADAMKHNRSIEAMLMGGGDVNDEGVQAIADMLAVNQVLTSLNLTGNQITDDGAKLVADALKNNFHLNILSIDGNCFTKASSGGKALLEAKRDTLKYLFLT